MPGGPGFLPVTLAGRHGDPVPIWRAQGPGSGLPAQSPHTPLGVLASGVGQCWDPSLQHYGRGPRPNSGQCGNIACHRRTWGLIHSLVIQSGDSAPGQQCPQFGPAGTKNFSTTRKAGATCSHQPARQTRPQPKGPGVPSAWLWLVRTPTLPTARRSQDPNQAQFGWHDDPASL